MQPPLTSVPDRVLDLLAIGPAVVTVVISTGLTLSPAPVGRLLALPADVRAVRAIGTADLALAAAMIVNRPRWPAMMVRSAANAALAWLYLSRSARARSPRSTRTAGRIMLGLTTNDAALGYVLARRGR